MAARESAIKCTNRVNHKNIKLVRNATKAGYLQKYETGNVNGDDVLWESKFKHLTQVTEKWLAKSSKGSLLPDAAVIENDFDCFRKKRSLDCLHVSVSNNFSSSSETICDCLDCEWSIHGEKQGITRLLQISFPNDKVAVVNLSFVEAFEEFSFPKSFKKLLENVNVLFFGRQMGGHLK